MPEQNATPPATQPVRTAQPDRGRRVGSRTTTSNSGFLMALIIGALALVLAFTAVTIALGRAPQPSDGRTHSRSTASTAAPATTYASPTPTGERLEAQPIQTPGVKAPVYEPPIETPKPTPSAGPSAGESPSGGEQQNTENAQPTAQATS